MVEVEELFGEFVARYRSGDNPDAGEYIRRAGKHGDSLGAMLTTFVAAVPPPAPSDAAIMAAAKQLGFGSDIRITEAARGLASVEGTVERQSADPTSAAGGDPDMLEQAAAAYREIGDWEAELAMLTAAAEGFRDQGRLSEAIAASDLGIELATASGEPQYLLVLLPQSASLLRGLGRPEDALSRCERALKITRELGDRRSEGAALRDIGSLLVVLGRPQQALAHYEEALAIARDLGDQTSESDITKAIAGVAAQRGPTAPSFLAGWLQLPAERALEWTRELVESIGGMEVAATALALKGVTVSGTHISVGLEAPHRDLGIGSLEIDRESGEVQLYLTNVIPELRATRPYLIFPLVKDPSSPRMRWAGAAEGMVEGVVRLPEPIDEIWGRVEVRIGRLESPTPDPPELLTHFFVASDLEAMGDLHLPYRQD
jgi:tetratricopeptide (TPR) repeat protein